jgi:hypothetical protein
MTNSLLGQRRTRDAEVLRRRNAAAQDDLPTPLGIAFMVGLDRARKADGDRLV